MSGEATFIVWAETHAAFWGTGMLISYMSEDEACRGFSLDETRLVTDWWSRSSALDALFREEGLPMTQALAETLDVHRWRHSTRPFRTGDITLSKLPLSPDFRTRLAWVPVREKVSPALARRAKALVADEPGVQSLDGWGWILPAAIVEREAIAVESAEHIELLDAYTKACCKAVAARIEKLPGGERTERVAFGDPELHMLVVGTPDVRAHVDGRLPQMPAALARIESRRPRLPRPVVHETEELTIHVETTVWMSSERCLAWTAAATAHAMSIAPRLLAALATARKKCGIAHGPRDGHQLHESADWFRTTMYFPGAPSPAKRASLIEALCLELARKDRKPRRKRRA